MIIDKAKLNEYANLNLGRVMNYSEMIEPFSKYIDAVADSKVFTGIPTIDEKLFGFRPPEVISILSEPDIGKTTFVMNFLKHQIDSDSFLKNKLLINFSLELNEYDLIERVLQMETGLNSFEIEKKFKSDQDFKEQCKMLVKKYDNIVSVIERVKSDQIISYVKLIEDIYEKKAGLLIIDYLQLVGSEFRDDYTRTTRNMQEIKETALLLNLPIIVTSQVSREAGKSDTGLTMSSGKASGAIEETSQIVLGLEKAKLVAGQNQIDQRTIELCSSGDIRLIRLKVLKKKRGKYLDEPLHLVLNYKNLSIYEYSVWLKRFSQLQINEPF